MSMVVEVRGHGTTFALELFEREFPSNDDWDDGNWLKTAVRLETGLSSGRFSAAAEVWSRAEEFLAFRDELRTILSSQAVTGRATLETMENQFGLIIEFDRGRGTLEAFVKEHVGARLEVAAAETDQSYLRDSLAQLDAVVAAFPVRSPRRDAPPS